MNFIWNSDTVIDEPVMFIRNSSGQVAGKLLFPALEIKEVWNYFRNTSYQEGRDFTIAADRNTIVLTENSRIPFIEQEQLYPAKDTPNSYPSRKNSASYMLHSEKELFPSYQISFSYRHSSKDFKIPEKSHCSGLPVLKKNLKDGNAFSMTVFGDSISTGLNSTKTIGLPPFNPPYFEILASEFKKSFSCDVTLHNESVAGMASDWGLKNVEKAAQYKSDLVILAWGMNDASAKRTKLDFKNNLLNQIQQIREVKPETEFILVSGMTANPEWIHSSPESHIEYLDALNEITQEVKGTLPANITDVWLYMALRKSYLDLSGNGLNHPNDFGHVIYAQVIFKSILNMLK